MLGEKHIRKESMNETFQERNYLPGEKHTKRETWQERNISVKNVTKLYKNNFHAGEIHNEPTSSGKQRKKSACV